jgi:glyoxylase-like metal-dependent hydrolase (beta-lactamase superfamily II)
VNVYLLRSGDEWALFDTGLSSEESLAAFQAALDEVGCPPTAIRKLIATHHHPDHFGASHRHEEAPKSQRKRLWNFSRHSEIITKTPYEPAERLVSAKKE